MEDPDSEIFENHDPHNYQGEVLGGDLDHSDTNPSTTRFETITATDLFLGKLKYLELIKMDLNNTQDIEKYKSEVDSTLLEIVVILSMLKNQQELFALINNDYRVITALAKFNNDKLMLQLHRLELDRFK